MANRIDRPAQTVDIIPAALADKPILANLYQLYVHDFSEFVDLELGEDGRFTYDPLPTYWTERDRFPFLIRVNGRLAGFALVKKGSDFSCLSDVWDMADFFIARGFRRSGVATSAALKLWKQFPGAWEVRVMKANIAALSFWRKAIAEFTGKAISPIVKTKDGEERHLFFFQSAG